MSGLHHSVTRAFGVADIVREKGYYKTADNTKMIRKTKDSKEQILARHQITEHCVGAGYLWMDRYHMSLHGLPYVFSEGNHYIMTDLIRHREANFSSDEEFLKVVESLAHWHSCARGVPFSTPLHSCNIPLTEIFKVQIKSLDSIRKKIRKSPKWSDFDVCTLKNYPEYRERMRQALQLLEGTGYLRRFNKAKEKNHICHSSLKEENLHISSDDIYITKLDAAMVNYQLNDLCGLIRRREKKHKDLSHSRILEVYSGILPLETEEEVILEAMLLYPFAFIKLVMEYYQKKRSWTPVAMTNKMKEILLT